MKLSDFAIDKETIEKFIEDFKNDPETLKDALENIDHENLVFLVMGAVNSMVKINREIDKRTLDIKERFAIIAGNKDLLNSAISSTLEFLPYSPRVALQMIESAREANTVIGEQLDELRDTIYTQMKTPIEG